MDATIRTHSSASTNGNLHRIVDTPELKWWQRLFKWEDLTVAGREVKGFVISPTIATMLLSALLGMAAWAYKTSTTDSRETLVAITRMETMLTERTTNFKEQQAELKHMLEEEKNVARMYREDESKKKVALLWALKQRGIDINLE